MNNSVQYPTHDWDAWHDFMPGSPPTLYITGKIVFPAAGYSAVLVRNYPGSINPTLGLYDLVVTKPNPSNDDDKGHFEEDVRYSEDTTEPYQQVEIHPGDIKVPVKTVS